MLRLRDIMTADVVTIDSGATVREAMELLSKHHVSGVPVTSGHALVGVVSATDLMAFAAALPGAPTAHEIGEGWDDDPDDSVNDVVEPENDAASAFFSEMWDDAGAAVTQRIANSSAPEWNALEEHDVSEVMTRTPLVTLGPESSAEAAAELMRRNDIHRILVTDGGTLVGIVSALDIAKAAANHRFTTRTFVFNDDSVL